MTITTLGPAGTFSHEAALTEFPQGNIELAPHFDAIFDAAEHEGKTGFVPFENSLHGSVDEVLDLLVERDVSIWKTHDVRIRHSFGARDTTRVSKVASHPQALAQCRTYLRTRFPDAERFPVSSTVYAVDLALSDPSAGAIASKAVMDERGLPVVDADIEMNGNTTRFAVIAKENPFPGLVRSEMGIVLHPIGDRPGLLHDFLVPFKVYGVNLTKIENRPTGAGIGDYVFFLHFQGRSDDPRIQTMLRELDAISDIEILKKLGEW